MEQQTTLNDQDLNLAVILPGGMEKMTTVPASKPMMDLLVTLCAMYHLNPASHTIELISANRNEIKFMPNAAIGSLEAEKVILKPKGDDKNKKVAPQIPEATVRLIINHKNMQKVILRVNPQIPLQELLPAVCEKCEFDQNTTVLLKDGQSEDLLDLSRSLNDYGLREVYARDNKGMGSKNHPASPESKTSPIKETIQRDKENKGLLSMFRKSKKKPDQVVTTSAPESPDLRKQDGEIFQQPDPPAPSYSSNSVTTDGPKKRRAPPPPLAASQSVTNSLGQDHNQVMSVSSPVEHQTMSGLSRGSSSEFSLKRIKRKAPPPPGAAPESRKSTDDGATVEGTHLTALQEVSVLEETTSQSLLEQNKSQQNHIMTGPSDTSRESSLPPASLPMDDIEGGGSGKMSSDEKRQISLALNTSCIIKKLGLKVKAWLLHQKRHLMKVSHQ